MNGYEAFSILFESYVTMNEDIYAWNEKRLDKAAEKSYKRKKKQIQSATDLTDDEKLEALHRLEHGERFRKYGIQ